MRRHLLLPEPKPKSKAKKSSEFSILDDVEKYERMEALKMTNNQNSPASPDAIPHKETKVKATRQRRSTAFLCIGHDFFRHPYKKGFLPLSRVCDSAANEKKINQDYQYRI